MTRILLNELHQVGELLHRDGHHYHGNIVRQAEEHILALHVALETANAAWRGRLHEFEYDPEVLLAGERLLP